MIALITAEIDTQRRDCMESAFQTPRGTFHRSALFSKPITLELLGCGLPGMLLAQTHRAGPHLPTGLYKHRAPSHGDISGIRPSGDLYQSPWVCASVISTGFVVYLLYVGHDLRFLEWRFEELSHEWVRV
ncbi:uncharacterized protein LOC124416592 [Diprion similis]|uniref:uncharacterized protein LOC124416592 n=1 Tax=Diprion similis TaxID=362088 RepID=UPI001EF8AEB4|nr:uncharacterized protein LOC124416592 [Diprion similis]